MERSIWVGGQVGGIGAMAQGGATRGVNICEDCVGLDSDHRADLFRSTKINLRGVSLSLVETAVGNA